MAGPDPLEAIWPFGVILRCDMVCVSLGVLPIYSYDRTKV